MTHRNDRLPDEIWKIGSAFDDYLVELCNWVLGGEVRKEWVDCTITPTLATRSLCN